MAGSWATPRAPARPHCPPLFPAADPLDFGPVAYVASNTTANSFTFNPDYQSQSNAEASCQEQGAHLAVYESEDEQAEVWC